MLHNNIKKAAVIGYPVKHSLSPRLHGFWLKKYGIAGEYSAIEVRPEELEDFIKSFRADDDFVGLNLTIPHKEAVIPMLDEVEDMARVVGAVNTIIVKDDGKLYGMNTDVYGFVENIKSSRHLVISSSKAVVLGAGGAAKAVVYALVQLGFKNIVITNRSKERAEELSSVIAHRSSVVDWNAREKSLQDADLLVNTTSLGMSHPVGGKAAAQDLGQLKKDPALAFHAPQDDQIIDLSLLPKIALVTDIVYSPLITPLLAQAQARGNPIVDGLGMLLHQAVPAFEAWFGVRPKVTQELRDFVLYT